MFNREQLRIRHMIQRLSPESYNYFATTQFVDKKFGPQNLMDGKFVRLGEVLFLGCTQEYGIPSPEGRYARLFHSTIARHALTLLNTEELAEASRVTQEEGALDKGFMIDAGQFSVVLGEGDRQDAILLSGKSEDYGRANLEVRERTLEKARLALGTSIEVVSF